MSSMQMRLQALVRRGIAPLALTCDTGGTLVLHLAVLLGATRIPLHAGVEALLVDTCLVAGTLRVIPATHRCSIK